MKKYLITMVAICAVAVEAMAQKPHYLPGDGVYIVGLPADLSKPYECPVMVAEAYQTTFKTTGTNLAAIKANDKSYNISDRLQSDGTLDLISFMGCGEASNLIVRNFKGESYSIGDYAPEKTWDKTILVAAKAPLDGSSFYTLGVYDHWDCPVTYAEDKVLTEEYMDGITVEFGNPHEGLVTAGVNFNLISPSADLINNFSGLNVTVKAWNDDHTSVAGSAVFNAKKNNLKKVGTTENGETIYSVYVKFGQPIIIDHAFSIDIDGLGTLGVDVWLPRAVDTHNLYPTHTTYRLGDDTKTVAESDACVNVDGYFNYLGMWGWPDGKEEFGEVVASGDYVQVYYDPSDPDWPGEFYTGEVTFPVECTFGPSDIMVYDSPSWIEQFEMDSSQWEEYESVLLIMHAEALPSDMRGRYGKVIFSTSDGASQYTIHIRQGNATFPAGIDGPFIDIPAEGGMFDLSGRSITMPQAGQVFIKNGKKYLNK